MMNKCSLKVLIKKIVTLQLLILLTQTSCVVSAEISETKQTRQGEAQFLNKNFKIPGELEYHPSKVELHLPNGNIHSFIAIWDGRREVKALLVSELRRAKNRSISNIPELSKLEPPAIFHALSKSGTPVPSFLRLTQTKPVYTQPQGWARNLVLSANSRPVSTRISSLKGGVGNPPENCPNFFTPWADFLKSILDPPETITTLTFSFLSEGDGPTTPGKGNHWTINPPVHLDRFILRGYVDEIQQFAGNVQYCQRDDRHDELTTSSPRVFWRVKEKNDVLWMSISERLLQVGDSFRFEIQETQSMLGNGLDVGLEISYPYSGDKFHIGATWIKFSDSLTITPGQ